MRTILLTFVSVCFIAGCSTQSYQINSAGAERVELSEDKMQHFFVGGLGQEQEMDAATVCGGADKVVAVESKLEPLDILLGMLSWGIYSPRHAKVYCK